MTESVQILNELEFREALIRESARCEVLLSNSCLVTIPVRTLPDSARQGVIQGLVGSARGTDLLGWLWSSDLGLLLPDTDVDGARKVVDKLQAIPGLGPCLTGASARPLPLEDIP